MRSATSLARALAARLACTVTPPPALVAAVCLTACGGPGPKGKPGDPTEPPSSFDGVRFSFTELEGFSLPPDVTELVARGDTLLAFDLSGQAVAYDWQGNERGSFQVAVHREAACGLLSWAFDPDFDTNGLVYFGACKSRTESGIYRAHLDLDTLQLTDRQVVLTGEEPLATQAWHNIGWIGFAADGALLGLFGEKTVGANASDLGVVLGKAIRVFPDKTPGQGGYEPHPDNPFAAGGGHPAIFAWGLRSPWTGAWDAHGNLWVGDVGSSEKGFEELDLVRAGDDLGWPAREGDCGDACGGTVAPKVAWPHTGGHPNFEDDPDISASIQRVAWVASGHDPAGPDPYRGLLDGVLYGDLCMGWVRRFLTGPDGSITEDLHVGHLMASAFVQDPDGYLLAARISGCASSELQGYSELYRLDAVFAEP